MKLKRIIISFIILFLAFFTFACSKSNDNGKDNNNDKTNTDTPIDNPKTDITIDSVKDIIMKEEPNVTIVTEVTENGKTESAIVKLEGVLSGNSYSSYKLSMTYEGEEIYYELKDGKYIAIMKGEDGKYVGVEMPVKPSLDIADVEEGILANLSAFTYDLDTKSFKGSVTIDGITGEVIFKVENSHVTYLEATSSGVKTVCKFSDFGSTSVTIPSYTMAGNVIPPIGDEGMSLTEWNAMLNNNKRNYTMTASSKAKDAQLSSTTIKYDKTKTTGLEYYYNFDGTEVYYKIIDDELFVITNDDDKWIARHSDEVIDNPIEQIFAMLDYSSFTYNKTSDIYTGTVYINSMMATADITVKVINSKVSVVEVTEIGRAHV